MYETQLKKGWQITLVRESQAYRKVEDLFLAGFDSYSQKQFKKRHALTKWWGNLIACFTGEPTVTSADLKEMARALVLELDKIKRKGTKV